MEYDVVIAGASISGCTAAVHLGRSGLRVALLEKHRSIETPKRLCGYFLLGAAQEPLQRLGVWDELVLRGGGTGQLAMWNEAGWSDRSRADGLPPFLNVRRSTLDPFLRRTAVETPGVDLLLGHRVEDLLRDDRGTIVGVRAHRSDGVEVELRARLVVGADGHRSRTAQLAGARERTFANVRAFVYGYYRDVEWTGPGDAALWWHGDDWAVLSPTDSGLTLAALMPRQDSVRGGTDFSARLEDYFARLPDGPRLRADQRVGKPVASLDYPLVRRDPTPLPGVALVGDAALTADPAPAPGCSWALLSGQWLAEHTAEPLRTGTPLHRALAGYRRARRRLDREFFFLRADAASGTANPVQRLLRTASVHDPVTAEMLLRVGMQLAPTSSVLRPDVLARAWAVRHRPREPVSARPAAAPPTGPAATAGR